MTDTERLAEIEARHEKKRENPLGFDSLFLEDIDFLITQAEKVPGLEAKHKAEIDSFGLELGKMLRRIAEFEDSLRVITEEDEAVRESYGLYVQRAAESATEKRDRIAELESEVARLRKSNRKLIQALGPAAFPYPCQTEEPSE